MSYKEIYEKTNQLYEERLVLVEDRIAQIADQPAVKEPFAQYFKDIAACILKLKNLKKDSGFNKEFYSGFLKENYGKNYADPEYAIWTTNQKSFELRIANEIGGVDAHESNVYLFQKLGPQKCLVADGATKLITFPLKSEKDITYYSKK